MGNVRLTFYVVVISSSFATDLVQSSLTAYKVLRDCRNYKKDLSSDIEDSFLCFTLASHEKNG